MYISILKHAESSDKNLNIFRRIGRDDRFVSTTGLSSLTSRPNSVSPSRAALKSNEISRQTVSGPYSARDTTYVTRDRLNFGKRCAKGLLTLVTEEHKTRSVLSSQSNVNCTESPVTDDGTCIYSVIPPFNGQTPPDKASARAQSSERIWQIRRRVGMQKVELVSKHYKFRKVSNVHAK